MTCIESTKEEDGFRHLLQSLRHVRRDRSWLVLRRRLCPNKPSTVSSEEGSVTSCRLFEILFNFDLGSSFSNALFGEVIQNAAAAQGNIDLHF